MTVASERLDTQVHGYGTLASRPAAGKAGREYHATDGSGTRYRDNGTSWDTLSFGAGTGTLATVEEADGSPTDSAVSKLVFPNGSLAIASHVATYTPGGIVLGATTVTLGAAFTTSSSTPQVISSSLDNTVVVRAGGKILVAAMANWQMDSGFNGYICVLESTTNVGEATFWSAGNSPAGMAGTVMIGISGISAGSHTYRLAIRTNGGGTMKVINLSPVLFTIFDWP